MNKSITPPEYLKNFIQRIPPKQMANLFNISQSEVIALFHSTDSEVTNFIFKYKLTNPNNLAKFVVNVHFAEVSNLYDGLYNIRKDYQNEWKSKLQSAQDKFNFGLNNLSTRKQDFIAARHQVMDCIRIFENDALLHISQIRRIDNQPEWILFFASFFNLITSRKEIPLAIESCQRLLNAYELLFTISSTTNDNVSSFKKQFLVSGQKIMADGNCLLMANYCESNKDKDFWYNFRDSWNKRWQMILETNMIFNTEKESASTFWNDDDLDLF